MVPSMFAPVFHQLVQSRFGPKFGLRSLENYSDTDWRDTHSRISETFGNCCSKSLKKASPVAQYVLYGPKTTRFFFTG